MNEKVPNVAQNDNQTKRIIYEHANAVQVALIIEVKSLDRLLPIMMIKRINVKITQLYLKFATHHIR